ncbi:beta strand repeat-containing protein [Limosilactobacillus fermentum]|uniref:beta strand repeat-containing protein n=1 Tax=Limosilactobacillus fermentum TaxID=1613 RepID=UPI0021A80D85|nr:gp58-like family protein [Limosilactobacillus fermentum]MCT3428287.1 hypothetical protein [Limosilactobacillus fermentum]
MLYRQIILEWGQDTESGVWGLGYSPDNGKNFYVLNTTHGRKYRAEDGNRLYPYISDQIQDKIEKVVAPAKSAADSAVSAADAAVASAQVTSDAVSAIASATAEAKQGANDAMIRAKSAWDVATGAKSAVTEFDPLLKQAQSDAVKAITQIADTASALSETKVALTSDVAVAKNLANVAQTTANNAVESAGENAKALISQANALSDARKAMDSDIASAKGLANAAQTTANSAIKSASSVANDLAAVASQAKANANGITKVTSDVGLLQTTVADNSGNISTIQETTKQIQQAVSDNSGNITVAKQTADSAVTVASDARSNATVASQTASQASITAQNASGQAASAVLTANGALTTASNAKSDATVAIQTASGASLTATNAKDDATVAKQTASEAIVQASNAESDFAQLSIRANKIEANVANNSGAIASVQQTANGLTTTVADIKANGGGVNLAKGTSSKDQSYGDASQTTGWNIITIATFDNPQAGQQYTISVNTRNNGGSWKIQFLDGTSPTQRGKWLSSGNNFTSTQGQKQTATITWPSGSNKYLLVQLVNSNDGGQIVWNSAMLEEGAVAHTWSPAHDDVQNQFTQIKESINGVTTIINDPKTGLNATYQTAAGNATTISNAQGDIAKLKTRADGFDTEFSTANGNISKLQTDANGTKQILANTKSDVAVLQSRADGLDAKYADAAGDINTLKANASGFSQTLVSAKGDISTLKATATGFKNTLTDAQGNISTLQSDVSGLKKTTSDNAGNIATLQADAKTLTSQMSSAQGDISTLKQTASGISSKVSGMETSLADANSKINDITSNGGGRNLLRGTSDVWTTLTASGLMNVTTANDTKTSVADYHGGDKFTYSTVITNKSDTNVRLEMYCCDKNGIRMNGDSNHALSDSVAPNTTAKKVSCTIAIDGNTWFVEHTLIASGGTSTSKTVQIKGEMFEVGTVAHDWSPAPEDTDAKITANTTAIEQNKNAIALKADQTNVDTLKGTVNQLQSSLSVQAGQIQTKVSASDVSGMLTGYATQSYTQSLVTQTANNWNLNLTKLQTDVNAIKTTGGGVNLVSGTAQDIVVDDTANTGTQGWRFYVLPISADLKVGDKITVSVENITMTGKGDLSQWGAILYSTDISEARSDTYAINSGRVSRMLCKKGNFARMNWQF